MTIMPMNSATPATGEAEVQPPAIVPRCHIPWQQMVMDSTGYVVPCCYWGAVDNHNAPLGNINEQTLDEIWNGPGFQKLRKHMAQGDLAAAGCANCYAVKQGMGLAFDYDADCLGETGEPSKYAKNIATLKSEIARGAAVLEARPTIVSFTPSHRCNIRCTHCYQESTRTVELNRKRAEDEVVALAPYLVRLIAGGGEPFLLPIWNKFLNTFDLNQNPYLDFATSTNATIVSDKILDGLKRFKKLTINVSMDGTGKAYEKVRVGAKFDQVVANIRKLRQVVGGARSTQSAIGVSMCVMKSDILDLPNFVRFCTDENLAFGVSPVVTLPSDEALTMFNRGPAEMAGWAEALDEAERLVQELYLPTMVRRRNENEVQAVERDFWTSNFRLLRAAIPFEQMSVPHYETTVVLPEYILANANVKDRGVQIAYLFDVTKPAAPARYWGSVVGGKIQVMLPAGTYSVSISTKWAPPEFWDAVRFRVPPIDGTIIEASFVSYKNVVKSKLPPVIETQLRRLHAGFRAVPQSVKTEFRDVKLPPAVQHKLAALDIDPDRADAFIYVLGQTSDCYVARTKLIGGKFSVFLPPGRYCVSFSAGDVSPGYWDAVSFAIQPDGPEVITATYRPVTAHRVISAVRRRIRKPLGATPQS